MNFSFMSLKWPKKAPSNIRILLLCTKQFSLLDHGSGAKKKQRVIDWQSNEVYSWWILLQYCVAVGEMSYKYKKKKNTPTIIIMSLL